MTSSNCIINLRLTIAVTMLQLRSNMTNHFNIIDKETFLSKSYIEFH